MLGFKFFNGLESDLLKSEFSDRVWLIWALMLPIKAWILKVPIRQDGVEIELKIAEQRSYIGLWKEKSQSRLIEATRSIN